MCLDLLPNQTWWCLCLKCSIFVNPVLLFFFSFLPHSAHYAYLPIYFEGHPMFAHFPSLSHTHTFIRFSLSPLSPPPLAPPLSFSCFSPHGFFFLFIFLQSACPSQCTCTQISTFALTHRFTTDCSSRGLTSVPSRISNLTQTLYVLYSVPGTQIQNMCRFHVVQNELILPRAWTIAVILWNMWSQLQRNIIEADQQLDSCKAICLICMEKNRKGEYFTCIYYCLAQLHKIFIDQTATGRHCQWVWYAWFVQVVYNLSQSSFFSLPELLKFVDVFLTCRVPCHCRYLDKNNITSVPARIFQNLHNVNFMYVDADLVDELFSIATEG